MISRTLWSLIALSLFVAYALAAEPTLSGTAQSAEGGQATVAASAQQASNDASEETNPRGNPDDPSSDVDTPDAAKPPAETDEALDGVEGETAENDEAAAEDEGDGKGEEAKENEDEKKDEFLRVVLDDKKTPTAMETAIVRYQSANGDNAGLSVDLVSAVHIADKSYYEQLNREFAKYDVVLYELVAPEGTRIPRGGGTGSGHPVSLLQNAMKDMLELEHQLTEVDYTAKNFVHADMSPEDFARSMEERDESFLNIFLRAMGYAMAKQQGGEGTSDAAILFALLDKNRALALKRVMAKEFQDIEGSMAAIDGPNGSTLIGERNKAALKVLSEQIAAGKKKIAIFYGGGHMPDFQRRLRDDFGLTPVDTRWLVAWKMESPKP